MPTCNRRPLIAKSVEYFLRQDYPAKELILVDDGDDPVADLVPDDNRIRYIRLDKRTPLWEKRNKGCLASCGELIAHWDDDDWIAPHRLSAQIRQLLEDGARVSGLNEVLHYQPRTGDAWLYRQTSGRHLVPEGTLVYYRDLWAERPFRQDASTTSGFLEQHWSLFSDRTLYVGLMHGGNTNLRSLAEPCWERRPLHEVVQLLQSDCRFYTVFRTGRPHHAPVSDSAARSVALGGHFDISTGYGSMAEYLALGLSRAGANVHLAPFSLHPEGMSAEFMEIARRSRPENRMPALYFSWPRPELDRLQVHSDLFINTMWESARLPQGWAERLNRSRAVIVPTRFVARVCRESGVTVPVEVIAEGIDPDVYYYVDRPRRDGLTTLTVGPLDNRKHVQEGIAAWKRAFQNDPAARLIIKTQYNYQNYVPDDPRIQYVDCAERSRGIARWYYEADVLLALGNEGFGLPLVEAMATGLPVIALNSEGQSDMCEDAAGLLLPVAPAEWRTYHSSLFGDCGLRGVPAVEDVAERLGWVRDNPEQARQMGRAASDWVQRNRNVWSKGPKVLEFMEAHARPARTLRRKHVMWCGSAGLSCGVAEYAAHLAHELPLVEVTREWRGIRDLNLLHVQHGERIFDEPELSRRLREAHQAGVRVVVTEHTVRPFTRSFEKDADVLVALTAHGGEMLQRTWPAKRIEHIPCGCPTWFPLRKQKRGRVIAAFGFLELHKGFWRLLKALPSLPQTELLLYSYAKSPATEASWNEAAKGLPVRRVPDYLPAEEIARRLADEADILVFWYDEASHASASAASRVGLATGVPVLTSQTSWFRDLTGVTYQPDDLVEGIRRLLEDTSLRDRLTAAARDFCHQHSWSRTADRHMALWRTVLNN